MGHLAFDFWYFAAPVEMPSGKRGIGDGNVVFGTLASHRILIVSTTPACGHVVVQQLLLGFPPARTGTVISISI